jgi:hypothetical protein
VFWISLNQDIAKGVDLNKQIQGAGMSYFPLCSVIGRHPE